jgi:hypothetical protein
VRAAGEDAAVGVQDLKQSLARRFVTIRGGDAGWVTTVFRACIDTRFRQDREVVLVEQHNELRKLDKACIVPFCNLARRLTVTPAESDRPNQRNAGEHQQRQATAYRIRHHALSTT